MAKYPESRDIFNVLEMDIQHNQNHVDYGFTDLIMNMVWAMLHSTGTAQRFANKLHSYLVNSKKLKFWFREFFTPNDHIHFVFPYEKEPEPKYNVKFAPCPKEMNYESTNGEWAKLTIGYKEHLIEELLMLWPEDKRETIRTSIMDEKAGQLKNFEEFAKKHIVEIIDEPETHLDINLKEVPFDQRKEDDELLLQQIAELKAEVNVLSKENVDLKGKLNASSFEVYRLREEKAKLCIFL